MIGLAIHLNHRISSEIMSENSFSSSSSSSSSWLTCACVGRSSTSNLPLKMLFWNMRSSLLDNLSTHWHPKPHLVTNVRSQRRYSNQQQEKSKKYLENHEKSMLWNEEIDQGTGHSIFEGKTFKCITLVTKLTISSIGNFIYKHKGQKATLKKMEKCK